MANTASARKRIFNLLKPHKEPPTVWDKIYDWIMQRARVVMIVCEIIVAFVFVGKVIVDMRAKDLDEQIKTKDFELRQYSENLEPELRKLQQKAKAYRNIWNDATDYSAVVKEINSYISVSASDITVRISDDKVVVKGGSNLNVLKQVENSMRASQTFTDVVLAVDTEGGSTTEGKYTINAILRSGYTREEI